MNSIHKIFATALLCSTVAFAEDDADKDGPDMRPLVYVDPKAVENKTDQPTANFSALIDRLNNALTESGMYRVLTPKSIGATLKDNELFQSLASDGGNENAMKTPGFKIGMTITMYGVASSRTQDMYGAAGESQVAKVELITHIFDLRTGENVKSKNITREASGRSGAQTSNVKEQTLQEANKKVVNDIVDELVKITPFNVLDVEKGEVVIDAPSSRVKPGQQLVVYKKGKAIRNKRTGKKTAKESQVAVIGVVTLGEDSVTCKLLSGEIKPDENAEEGSEYDKYIVRIPDTSPAATTGLAAPTTPANANAAPF